MDLVKLNKYGFEHLSQAYNKAGKHLTDIREGKIKPYKTTWQRTNNILGGGLQKSTTITIAGRPGIGKSAYSNRLIFDICECNDISKTIILYWNWEMPNYQQVIREMSFKTNHTVQELKSQALAIEEFNKLKELKTYMSSKPIWMLDKSKNAEFIRRICKEIQAEFPDYQIINLFDHTRLSSESGKQNEFEEAKIKDLYSIARELSVEHEFINIFLSQLNRNIESENRLKNPIPVASDLFGADAVGQFSNIIIMLQRPEMYAVHGLVKYMGITDIHNLIVAHFVKNRDGDVGYVDYEHTLKYNKIIER